MTSDLETYSYNILNMRDEGLKTRFCTVETNLLHKSALTSNLCFNKQSLNKKKTAHIHQHIYIYIYIYIIMYIYINLYISFADAKLRYDPG